MAAAPARTPEESRAIFAKMQDLEPGTYLHTLPVRIKHPGVRTMRDMIPQCYECGNSLLPQSRGLCSKDNCRKFVCLRTRKCQEAHRTRHLQEHYSKLAVDMSLRGLANSEREKVRRMIEGKTPFQVFDEAGPVVFPDAPDLFDRGDFIRHEETPFPVMTPQEKSNAGLAL
jgi:hypothetical protein